MTERRISRSNKPEEALHFLCEAVARDCGLNSVIVTQNSGLLVAGAGKERERHLLAAFTPLLSKTEDLPARLRMFEFLSNHIQNAQPEKFAMQSSNREIATYFVAVRGETFAERELGLHRVLSGIERIM